MILRGSGPRKPGEIHMVIPPGDADQFIVDPPVRWDDNPPLYNVVQVLLDQLHYPNAADFIEEAEQCGISTRIERSIAEELEPGVRIVVVHPNAIITNPEPYWESWADPGRSMVPGGPATNEPWCPSQNPEHSYQSGFRGMCSVLWWHDLLRAEPVYNPVAVYRAAKRVMPGFHYYGLRPPDSIDHRREAGIIFSAPIHHLAVIAGGYPRVIVSGVPSITEEP